MSPDAAGTLGLVPARRGSQGIPHKNVRELAGAPLVSYTFDVARRCACFDRLVVSTDDDAVVTLARRAGVEVPFMRPAELASATAAMVDVVHHALVSLAALDGYEPRYVALLQPTAPLRTERHIREALDLLDRSGADSVVSVTEVPGSFHPFWVHNLGDDGTLTPIVADGPGRYTRRQALPPVYCREGTIYAFRRETVLEQHSLYGRRTVGYVVDESDVLHLDSERDWMLAEAVMLQRKGGRVPGDR